MESIIDIVNKAIGEYRAEVSKAKSEWSAQEAEIKQTYSKDVRATKLKELGQSIDRRLESLKRATEEAVRAKLEAEERLVKHSGKVKSDADRQADLLKLSMVLPYASPDKLAEIVAQSHGDTEILDIIQTRASAMTREESAVVRGALDMANPNRALRIAKGLVNHFVATCDESFERTAVSANAYF